MFKKKLSFINMVLEAKKYFKEELNKDLYKIQASKDIISKLRMVDLKKANIEECVPSDIWWQENNNVVGLIDNVIIEVSNGSDLSFTCK